jgi:hypothetical protein
VKVNIIMKIIATTFKSVLVIDLNDEKIHRIHEGAGVYYGITWDKERLFVASRFGYKDELGQVERVAIFNKKLRFSGYLSGANDKNAGYHAIQYDPKFGNLWITAPHQNKIIILGLKSGKRHEIYPNEEKIGKNWNHFNSVTLHKRYMMINAHNGIGVSRTGQVYFCNRKDFSLSHIVDMKTSSHTHNCFIFKKELYTCSSDTGLIVNRDGKPLRPGRLKGYNRGIAISDKVLLVGESARAAREDRVNADGFIHIYDIWKLNLIKTISLPKCGQILSIRILDRRDRHHQLHRFL